MAKPIKETPVLKGKDAVNFIENQRNYDRVAIAQAEKERMYTNYQKLQSLLAIDCGYDKLSLHELRDSYSPELLDIHYPNRMPQKQPSVS